MAFLVPAGGGAGGIADVLTTKGDLLGFASDYARLAVGTDGQVLSAASGQTTGLQWIDAAGGGTVQGADHTYDLRPTSDGATAGTTARGENSVDLQTHRSAGTQVAAGQYSGILSGTTNQLVGASTSSVICGGSTNSMVGTTTQNVIAGGFASTITNGSNSVIGGGRQNAITGTYMTIGGGLGNAASGTGWATVGGGDNNQATGSHSTVGGGDVNTATALGATVAGGVNNDSTQVYATCLGGNNNISSGQKSTAGGDTCTASGDQSLAIGNTCIAAGTASVALGHRSTAHRAGEMAWSSHNPGTGFETQWFRNTAYKDTTDATQTEVQFGPSGTQVIDFENDHTMHGTIYVTAAEKGTGAGGRWNIPFMAYRDGAANTVLVLGASSKTPDSSWGTVTGWVVDVDCTSTQLRVQVTGAASTNIRWMVRIEADEIRNNF